MKTAEQRIFEMLVKCTGQAICDSGGIYGRNWEHNQGRALVDFRNEPEVKLNFHDGIAEGYTIGVFHYLTKQIELDGICQEFNDVKADDWDAEDYYGVSAEGSKLLNKYNVEIGEGFNSYNGESSLSQVIQGTYVKIAGNGYVVLQIHGGCDVRGGYTDAKLFKIVNDYGEFLAPEDVHGTITPKDADVETPALLGCEHIVVDDVIQFSNSYDGYNLKDDEDDSDLVINEADNVSISLSIW